MAHVKRKCKTRSEGPLRTPLNPPASRGRPREGRVTLDKSELQMLVASVALNLNMSQKDISLGFGDESKRYLKWIARTIVDINFNLVGCLVD